MSRSKFTVRFLSWVPSMMSDRGLGSRRKERDRPGIGDVGRSGRRASDGEVTARESKQFADGSDDRPVANGLALNLLEGPGMNRVELE